MADMDPDENPVDENNDSTNAKPSHPSQPLPDPDVDLSDEIQDFRFLSHLSHASKSESKIPKRGEKDFEPHSTSLQINVLSASREAMHAAVSFPRLFPAETRRDQRRRKGNVAIYHPRTGMAYVNCPKGIVWRNMGRVYKGGEDPLEIDARMNGEEKKRMDGGNRQWLLPEEALYLIERGTIECRWPNDEQKKKLSENENSNHDNNDDNGNDDKDDDVNNNNDETDGGDDDDDDDEQFDGLVMSVQGAHAAFIGMAGELGDGLTYERYSVYSYLKRGGYSVHRAPSWDKAELTHPPSHYPPQTSSSLFSLSSWTSLGLYTFSSYFSRLSSLITTVPSISDRQAHGPLIGLKRYRSYIDVYRSLSLIPYYDPTTPLYPPSSPSTSPSSSRNNQRLRIIYQVHKPNNPSYRKSSPGRPDFLISVLNARTSTFPTLKELNELLKSVPYEPPPKTVVKKTLSSGQKPQSETSSDNKDKEPVKEKEMHVYGKIKHAYKSVIIAVVDQGVSSFIRIGDSGMEREKLYEKIGQGGMGKGKGHGKGRNTNNKPGGGK